MTTHQTLHRASNPFSEEHIRQLVLNPTSGLETDKFARIQERYKEYTALCYGLHAMWKKFVFSRVFRAAQRAGALNDLIIPGTEFRKGQGPEYDKEGLWERIFRPADDTMRGAIQQFRDKLEGLEGFLQTYATRPEAQLDKLVNALLDFALLTYEEEIAIAQNPEHQPEYIQTIVQRDGSTRKATRAEKREAMRTMLHRLNRLELDKRNERERGEGGKAPVSRADTQRGRQHQSDSSSSSQPNLRRSMIPWAVIQINLDERTWKTVARCNTEPLATTKIQAFLEGAAKLNIDLTDSAMIAIQDPTGKAGKIEDSGLLSDLDPEFRALVEEKAASATSPHCPETVQPDPAQIPELPDFPVFDELTLVIGG